LTRALAHRLAADSILAAAFLGACASGDVARPGPRDAPVAIGNPSDGGGGDERAVSSDTGGACNSCSVDTDCRNACPAPSMSGDVWCCGYGLCFTWARACPPLGVAAADGGSLESGPDGPPDDGGLLNAPGDCQPTGVHGGHRWQDLYNCYFGPRGNVACGSAASCHGQSSDPGALASHFVCGPTSDACWQSLTTLTVPPDGGSDPTMARLYAVLCKSDGSGIMPQGCPERLLTGDLARIAAWIQGGAPND
jgi:hypothetical protein